MEAITKLIDGEIYEPYEKITIDCPIDFIGVVTEELSSRLGQMMDMRGGENNMRIVYVLKRDAVPNIVLNKL